MRATISQWFIIVQTNSGSVVESSSLKGKIIHSGYISKLGQSFSNKNSPSQRRIPELPGEGRHGETMQKHVLVTVFSNAIVGLYLLHPKVRIRIPVRYLKYIMAGFLPYTKHRISLIISFQQEKVWSRSQLWFKSIDICWFGEIILEIKNSMQNSSVWIWIMN